MSSGSHRFSVKSLLVVTAFTSGLCLTSISSPSFGADSKDKSTSSKGSKKKTPKKDNEKVKDKKSFEKEDSKGKESEKSAGPDKKWELLLNAGLDPQPLLGVGATFGRNLKPGLALEVFASRASGKIEPVAVNVLSVGTRIRKSFLGKIPYVAGGLGFSMASGSWYTYNFDQTDELPSTSSSNALTLNLALGAQMQFGSFLVGADLAGIVFPIVKMGVKDGAPSDPYDENDFAEQKAKFNKLTGMTMVLCKVGIGFAF